MLTIITKGGSELLPWAQIYYLAVDIVTACVQQKKSGSSIGFGEHLHFQVTLCMSGMFALGLRTGCRRK